MWQDIHQAVQDADYRRGLELFAVLNDPSPQAFRWAGVCHFHLSNLVEARLHLLTAVSRGEEAARVQLACCLRYEGELAAAREHLERLNVDELEPDDAAHALRELAVIEKQCGAIAHAATLLDRAWGHAVAARPTAQAAVAQSIGLIASPQGNDRKAERYLEFAARHANDMQRVYILAAQANCAGYLGRFEQARAYLEAAEGELERFPLMAPLLAYRWGMYWYGVGELERAREAFERCVSLSQEAQQPSTELFAHLGAAAVATVSADEAAERRHLMRAQALVEGPRDHAYLNLRSGAARVRQGDTEGLPQLEAALAGFRKVGQTREVVWTLLHLTEAHAARGDNEAASQTLREAADSHLMLGGQQDLTAELAALPRTRALLAALPPEAYERALCHARLEATPGVRVHLVTLGRIEIQVNGHAVRTRLRRSPELLAFLLLRGPVTLEILQDEVLHGMPLDRTRNYLHQVRHELGRLLPGLGVLYDAGTRTYGLQAEGVELSFDWQQLGEQMRVSPGEFLQDSTLGALDFFPGIGSEWIRMERERMGRWIVRVGLETMEDWYQVGDYAECVSLAERLIEIEPLDAALHDFLIRATFELQGHAAAGARCRESERMFVREVGHVPRSLQELSRRLDAESPDGLEA